MIILRDLQFIPYLLTYQLAIRCNWHTSCINKKKKNRMRSRNVKIQHRKKKPNSFYWNLLTMILLSLETDILCVTRRDLPLFAFIASYCSLTIALSYLHMIRHRDAALYDKSACRIIGDIFHAKRAQYCFFFSPTRRIWKQIECIRRSLTISHKHGGNLCAGQSFKAYASHIA